MTSVYDLLRQRCGLSQQEAADVHSTRLDTIKSWCSGRRLAARRRHRGTAGSLPKDRRRQCQARYRSPTTETETRRRDDL